MTLAAADRDERVRAALRKSLPGQSAPGGTCEPVEHEAATGVPPAPYLRSPADEALTSGVTRRDLRGAVATAAAPVGGTR